MIVTSFGQSRGLGADDPIVTLKIALRNLAVKAPWPAVDPGNTDQNLDNQTITAISNIVAATPSLPSELRTAFKYSSVLTALSSDARAAVQAMIRKYAAQITGVVNVLAARYSNNTTPPPPVPNDYQIPSGGTSATILGTGAFPAGTIATRGKIGWRIAFPIGSGLSGAFGRTLQLVGHGSLGAATHTEATGEAPDKRNAAEVDSKTFDKLTGNSIFKKWWFWVASGVGVAAVATTVFLVTRKK